MKKTKKIKEKKEDKVCPCCYDSLKTSKTSKLTCSSCLVDICIECVKTFLLQNEKTEAECPLCEHHWNDEFIRDNTPKVFHNDIFRKYKAKVELSVEKSLFPAAMVHVQREKRRRKDTELLKQLKKERNEYLRKLREIKQQIYSIERGLRENEKDELIEEETFYSRPCPVTECNGSLNNRGKCGLCEIDICLKCEQVKKDDEHVCKKEDVDSVKEKIRSTKPCPKCRSRIYKTEGCSHMFCTKPGCYTSFDWVTGKMINDNVNTNPHFYAFRAANGIIPRNPRDVICGGLPSASEIRAFFYRYSKEPGVDGVEILRSLHHNQNVMMPMFRPEPITNNVDLSVKFLMKEITEEKYEIEIRKRNKKREKTNAVYNVLQMYVQTMNDMIMRIYRVENTTDFNSVFIEMINLQKYVNTELDKILQKFNNTTPVINNFFIMYRTMTRSRSRTSRRL